MLLRTIARCSKYFKDHFFWLSISIKSNQAGSFCGVFSARFFYQTQRPLRLLRLLRLTGMTGISACVYVAFKGIDIAFNAATRNNVVLLRDIKY